MRPDVIIAGQVRSNKANPFAAFVRAAPEELSLYLRHRLIRPCDLETCFSLTRDGHLYAPDEASELLRFWAHLIEGENSLHAAIEESGPRGRSRLLYFCICVALRNEFVEEACAGTQPAGLSRQVFLAWNRGESPVLSPREIAAANASAGLRVFVLHSGYPLCLEPTVEMPLLLSKVVQWVPYMLGGYRLNELLIESFSDFSLNWCENAGFTRRLDYAAAGCVVPAGYRDCLSGINAEEARERLGTPFAPLLTYRPPQFSFTEGERRLLLHALSEEPDARIAGLLCLSSSTVKKRWSSIFLKMQAALPHLFPGGDAADDRSGRTRNAGGTGRMGGGRGPEKRRLALSYLDQHPEELRPYRRKPGGAPG